MRIAHERVLPFATLIAKVLVPLLVTPVFTLTPGPFRWKLCSSDLSFTTSEYFPAFVGFFIEIVKPGPTVAGKLRCRGENRQRPMATAASASRTAACVSSSRPPQVRDSPERLARGTRLSRRSEPGCRDRPPRERIVLRPRQSADADGADATAALERGDAALEEGEERVEARALGGVLAGLGRELAGRVASLRAAVYAFAGVDARVRAPRRPSSPPRRSRRGRRRRRPRPAPKRSRRRNARRRMPARASRAHPDSCSVVMTSSAIRRVGEDVELVDARRRELGDDRAVVARLEPWSTFGAIVCCSPGRSSISCQTVNASPPDAGGRHAGFAVGAPST